MSGHQMGYWSARFEISVARRSVERHAAVEELRAGLAAYRRVDFALEDERILVTVMIGPTVDVQAAVDYFALRLGQAVERSTLSGSQISNVGIQRRHGLPLV